jgi:4-amino-4-deoxy-L-arabinose transferase-like glycosyltransferase
MQNNLQRKDYLLILLTAVIAWLPIIFTSFINDDFQILGWHSGAGAALLFKPFVTTDVSGFYWRPLGNILHTITLLLFGLNPLAFRLGNLLLYAFCSFLIAHTGLKLGFSKNAAFVSALIFSVLPAHEILVGWIAAKGEILVAVFILVCINLYYQAFQESGSHKNLLTGFIFFILAILVKELAFALVLIPFLILFSFGNINKENFKKAFLHFLAGIISIILILLLRRMLLGNNPFLSPHFTASKPSSWLLNIILYIPLSFATPEMLENLAPNSGSILLYSIFGIIFLFVAVLILSGLKKINKDNFRSLIFPLMWFIIFIIPVAPVLMRWYPFTASIGLVWIVVSLIEKNNFLPKIKHLGILLVAVAVIGMGIYDFVISLDWYRSGRKMDTIMENLKTDSNLINTPDILLMAVPDKYKNVPLMKLGVQQTFEYALDKKNLEVFSPLRILSTANSKIETRRISTRHYLLTAVDAVFYCEGKSREIGAGSLIRTDLDGVQLIIKNYVPGQIEKISTADVIINSRYDNYSRLYYDGNKFVSPDIGYAGFEN